ncbi:MULTISPECIES: hypothetical protein [unclassified Polynucleobacter]|uniref:hypothetical protein n=1 Tax=unclassified Polynucleobacter TaxID=2640945 RepID=UPI00257290CF|nr:MULTISPECIES: hypothetical protein [unclassified Polynucleobacter]BEI35164.1 hypothetical protein PHIN6_06820 [Polynucleobacter sp. HIN6]BEI36990.1 hypothetical protein PHIN7_07140 [Polynucleobacter sp. HIN7]
MNRLSQLLLLGISVLASQVSAAPMGFKNSWMIMGDFSKTYQEFAVNYAATANDAFGFSTSAMQTDNSVSKQQNAEAVYTRKLARWNMPEAQANIWFIGGLGATTGNTFVGTKAMASPGIQVDYETTRFYSMASARVYAAEGATSNITVARLGASFYEVDYDEAQPWLIIEARRMTFVSKQYEFTPMLRVIHNRYFVEAGANLSGQWRFNFMYNY